MKKLDFQTFNHLRYGYWFFQKRRRYPEGFLQDAFKTGLWPVKNILFDDYGSWK